MQRTRAWRESDLSLAGRGAAFIAAIDAAHAHATTPQAPPHSPIAVAGCARRVRRRRRRLAVPAGIDPLRTQSAPRPRSRRGRTLARRLAPGGAAAGSATVPARLGAAANRRRADPRQSAKARL